MYYDFVHDGTQLRLGWARAYELGSTSVFMFSVVSRDVEPVLPALDIVGDFDGKVECAAGVVSSKLQGRPVDANSTPFLLSVASSYLHGKVSDARLGEAVATAYDRAVHSTTSPSRVRSLLSMADAMTGYNAAVQKLASGFTIYDRFLSQAFALPRDYTLRGLLFMVLLWCALEAPGALLPMLAAWLMICVVVAGCTHFGIAWRYKILPVPELCWLATFGIPLIPAVFLECILGFTHYGAVLNCIMELVYGTWYYAPLHLAFTGVLGACMHLASDGCHHVLEFYDVCCCGRCLASVRRGATFKVGSGSCEPVVRLRCFTVFSRFALPIVPRRCVHNEVVGVRNRVTMPVPEASGFFWMQARRAMLPLIAGAPKVMVTWFEWLKRFPEAKRTLLQAHELGHLTKGMYYVTPMLKIEKLVKGHGFTGTFGVHHPSAVMTVEEFDPRVISIRTPQYQARYGPYCLAASDSLKVIWNVQYQVTYACGMPMSQVGEWLADVLEHFPDPYFVCADFHRFDGHISVPALQYEYWLLGKVNQRNVKGWVNDLETRAAFPDTQTEYTVTGTRKSGNADTTVGNSVINVGFWSVVLKRAGLTWNDARLIVMGDDSVLALRCRSITQAQIDELAQGSGLSIKVELTRDWHELKFCSCRFFSLHGGGYRMASLPGRYIAKGGFALNAPNSERYRRNWIKSYAFCLVAEYAHVPVMRALALYYARRVFGIETYAQLPEVLHKQIDIARYGMHVGIHGSPITCVPLLRYGIPFDDFCLSYDVTLSDIYACESYILALPYDPPIELRHWVIDRMLEVDLD